MESQYLRKIYGFALVQVWVQSIPVQGTSQDRCKAVPRGQPSEWGTEHMARDCKDNLMTSTSIHSTGNSDSLRSAVLSTPLLAVLSSVSHWTGVFGSMGRALLSKIGIPALLGSNGILLCNVLTVLLAPFAEARLCVSNTKPELCFCYYKTETTKKLYF